MMWMEREKIKSDRKEKFLPRKIFFNEFIVGCETLQKVQDFLVKNCRLRVSQARHFDPEGYINDIRVNKLKEKGYFILL